MILKELKEYILSLPTRLDSFKVVNGEMVATKGEATLAMVNNQLSTIYVDEKTSEIQFLHQTEQDIKDLVNNTLNGDK